jgi:GT2 family glycosyltransferase
MAGTWILIPNYNGMRWLPGCLGTLGITVPMGTPILVVDNGSTDGSVEYIRREFPDIRILELEINLGFVQAMNLAILKALKAGAESVVLLNNDTRVSHGWYTKVLEVAARHPGFGILGPIQSTFDMAPSPRTQAIVNQW